MSLSKKWNPATRYGLLGGGIILTGCLASLAMPKWIGVKENRTASSQEENRLSGEAGLKAEMISRPFGWQGVNNYAKEHYGMTNAQADAVALVARHARFFIARKITDSMREIKNPVGAQREWEFKTFDGFTQEIEAEVRKRLTAAVNAEYAVAAIPMLTRDRWFLGAGTSDVRILLNPNNERSYRGEDMITFQFLDKKGQKSGSMSIVSSLAREALRIDLDHADID